MRKLEEVYVKYIGYQEPDSEDELEMELLGLDTALYAIKSRIAILQQSRHMKKMMDKTPTEAETSDEKTVEKAQGPTNQAE